jgi:hypothetical protein
VLNLSGEREQIVGPVRLGTTEEFGAHYLAPRLAALTAGHPGLEIELVALPRAFSLATREVDVMITFDRPVTGDVRYKKLTDLEFGVYGSAAYFDGRPRPVSVDELSLETWCGYIKELMFTPELDVLSDVCDDVCFKYRTTSMTVQRGARRSCAGRTALFRRNRAFGAGAATSRRRRVPAHLLDGRA